MKLYTYCFRCSKSLKHNFNINDFVFLKSTTVKEFKIKQKGPSRIININATPLINDAYAILEKGSISLDKKSAPPFSTIYKDLDGNTIWNLDYLIKIPLNTIKLI